MKSISLLLLICSNVAVWAEQAHLVISLSTFTGSPNPPQKILHYTLGEEPVEMVIPQDLLSDPNSPQVKDLIVLTNGTIRAVTGAFEPRVITYDGKSWTTSDRIANWSSVNCGTYGAIEYDGENVYLSDMLDDGHGIIRLKPDGSSERIMDNVWTFDLALDGKKMHFLAHSPFLEPHQNQYGVLSLETQKISWYTIPQDDYRAIDARGDSVYLATWDGKILHYRKNRFVDSIRIKIPNGPEDERTPFHFSDLDVSPDGMDLACGTADGYVVIVGMNAGKFVTAGSKKVDKSQYGGGTTFVTWR